LKKFIIGAIITICLFLVIMFLLVKHDAAQKDQRGSTAYIKSSEVSASGDQQKLLKSFGYPDVFTLTNMEMCRFEIWTYYDQAQSFSFLNGRFQENMSSIELSDKFGWPSLRPGQFRLGMTEEDVKNILNEPTAVASFTTKGWEDIIMYDYFDQVKVAFKDGKLFYARTLPVPVGQGELK